jgi:DNA-binding NarL/FixJ family response regulator
MFVSLSAHGSGVVGAASRPRGRRFDLHEATVGYWVKKHGLEAANRAKHVSRGGIAREDLEVLVEAGKSIAEIAEALDRSKATVRHWLLRHGLKRTTVAEDAHLTRQGPPSRLGLPRS